jgi:predicted nucleotide-binding protein (sugar kinase/HSP70/actin superfamily)
MEINKRAIQVIEWLRDPVRQALRGSEHYTEPARIEQTADAASHILSIGNQCGEGWLLTGEMVELIHSGVENIVCLQPFGCLPNHIVGKGMLKQVRRMNPKANVAAIDFDPGASTVNQLNRIKLMMSTARKNLNESMTEEERMRNEKTLAEMRAVNAAWEEHHQHAV